ncbi:hypothetical protein LEMLEM_LOCUS14334 [Lemmus lemmus]
MSSGCTASSVTWSSWWKSSKCPPTATFWLSVATTSTPCSRWACARLSRRRWNWSAPPTWGSRPWWTSSTAVIWSWMATTLTTSWKQRTCCRSGRWWTSAASTWSRR